jgi:hypothetical protein
MLTALQFITLLDMLLTHLANAQSDKQMSVDISSTLSTLGAFIARFNHDASLGKLRIKFCLLIESAAKRTDVAGLISKDIFADHAIMDIIAGWVVIDRKQVHFLLWDSCAIIQMSSQTAKEAYTSHQREINTACLRAIVHVLEKCSTPPDNGLRDGDSIHNMTRFRHRHSELILEIGAYDRVDVS